MTGGVRFHTRLTLGADLARLGLRPGDSVMVHAALRKVGPLLHGPDALIDALLDVTAPGGTVLAYTDWESRHHELAGVDGRVPDRWRAHVPGFDPLRSRAIRANGAFPELLRTRPGAQRSGNPGASVAALGARAEWFTAGHPLDYGYGPDSPLERLVYAGGRVLMVGAPLDTMTLLHHAEHLARLPGKRVVRADIPFAAADGVTLWSTHEEFDTESAVVDGLPDDYFDRIVTDFLGTGRGQSGRVGDADTVLVDAAAVVAHAVGWLEQSGRSS